MAARIVDLSYPLCPETPVFPNYPPVEITILDATDRRKPDGTRALNSSHLAMGLHCGTHMDAPFHFFASGRAIDLIEPERCVGPATVIRLLQYAQGGEIAPADLAPAEAALRETGKALLVTGWYRQWGRPGFFSEHPTLSGATAHQLVEWGVHLVAVDMPSVDRPPFPAHLELLGNGTLIVENLTNLGALRADRVELIALPLKIVGRDGSPARVIVREE
jgi:kynurenine formamidase